MSDSAHPRHASVLRAMSGQQVWMFGGQGSQSYHMGAELYESDSVFRGTMERCSEMVRERLGVYLPDVLYSEDRGRDQAFDSILLTHPTLFIIQYSVAQTLLARGLRPGVLLGYSLGEFVCCVLAGMVELDDGLNLVVSQAECIRDHCPEGGMTAVLCSLDGLEKYRNGHFPTVAAVNYREHVVLSGRTPELEEVEGKLRRDDVTFVRLPVRYGFHSREMDLARDSFLENAQRVRFRRGTLRIASSCTAGFASDWTPSHGWRVAREPIRFADTLALLEGEGPNRYVDLGPNGTLANFVKYGLPGTSSRIHNLFSPFGGEARALGRLADALG